jgi:hypothetical protein
VLADPPGTFDLTLPVELFIWVVVVAVSPVVLAYLFFVVRELGRVLEVA